MINAPVTIAWFRAPGRTHEGRASDGSRYLITSRPFGSVRVYYAHHVTGQGPADITTARHFRTHQAMRDAVRHANRKQATSR